MKRFFYALCILVLMISCVSLPKLPPDVSLGRKIILPFRIDNVTLVDLRKDTVSIELDLPLFATRQKEWSVNPTFKGSLEAEIMKMIADASNPDGLPTDLTLTIKDGYYRIAGNARNVSERTLFECIIKFVPKNSNQYWNSSGQAYNDLITFNATQKHAIEMYRITVRNCVHKALQQGETLAD